MAKIETLSFKEFFDTSKEMPRETNRVTKIKRRDVLKSKDKSNLKPLALATLVATPLAVMATTSLDSVSAINLSSTAFETAQNIDIIEVVPQDDTTGDGWSILINKVLWIVDFLMDGVIIFSGISWMFGNRTKAIELLFGAGVGYVIVRHHEDIKNFFALL